MRATIHTPLALLLAACAGSPGPSPAPTPDPAIEQTMLQHTATLQADRKAKLLATVMLDIDRSLEAYVLALDNQGVARADTKAVSIERHLREIANSREHYQRLLTTAADSSNPAYQGFALAALGFADGNEVMPVILQGAQLPDDFRVNCAVLGLAVKQDPKTPPGILIRIIEDEERPEPIRIHASWALYRIHEAQSGPRQGSGVEAPELSPESVQIVAFWHKVLQRPMNAVPPAILANAIRALGMSGNPEHAQLVHKFASHATPGVRFATAIALGRMKNRDSLEVLYALLGPAESNANTRLAARKALQALAGGSDQEYDVAQWRKVFEFQPVESGR